MATRLSAQEFAAFLVERWRAGDGYIMGAVGQNPRIWPTNDRKFTQYSGAQRTQALLWRKKSPRVWDCQGMSEGYINDKTGSRINTYARNNYATWCDPKGKGVIPAKDRVPGAAVFKANKAGWIHHVGYLVAPVVASNPAGDWYIVEAKGVMYGVVRTKLSDGGWNRWGLMTKYFEYPTISETVPVIVTVPADPPESYNCNWIVATSSVNVRKGPGANCGKRMALSPGDALMYDGAVDGEWYAVDVQGKRCWVSSRYTKVEVHEKPIIDISRWNTVKDWAALAKKVSFVFIKVGSRLATSNGPLKIDAKFIANAKAANATGIPWGGYFYGRAKTAGQAVQEASQMCNWANPYGPTVYMYDVEVKTNTFEAVQTFVNVSSVGSAKPCGTYIGRMWDEVQGDRLKRAFQVSPYYNTGARGPSWLRFHGRKPSHKHDFHQHSPSLIIDGISGVDVSYVNDDPATQYSGHDVLWLRTGGKQGR